MSGNFGANPTGGLGSSGTNPTGGFTFGGGTAPSGQTKPNSSGFSFGTPGPTTTSGGQTAGGFSFGAQNSASQANTSTPAGGFSFGTSNAPAGGFSFGGQSTAAPAATTAGFSFGGQTTTPAAPAAASSGFNFGGQATTAAAPAAAPAATTAGFSFGNQSATVAPASTASGLSFNTQTTTAAGGTSGFSLVTQPSTGAPAATPGFGFGQGVPASKPIASEAPKLGATQLNRTAAASTGFSFSKPGALVAPSTTTAAGGLTLGTTTAPTAQIGLQQTATKPAMGLSVGTTLGQKPTLGGIAATGLLGATTAATSTVTTTAAGTGAPQRQMNYQQLEEQINKWMTDLEKQEKGFLEQATQVNAWDRLLMENGEKITALNNDMERVKVDQQKLDHELDFITSQQRELEELLVPLEKGVEQLPSVSFQQHTDLERENTYQLAENVDAQLKRMLQDLKEIVDHLNTTNTNQDQNDPVHQITKILNSHMDSLQWIDQNSAFLSRKVEEISKQMELQRKEQESNYRLVYN